ncbi:alcohol dehydrogenase catalytic domain-containing protein [Gordonia sp. (in: high G+C Gram-positive bacteria)]|uniref:alcohol dehydrogenase catalytic domain-containing protein n=1 Tax=Gordonia sp. (in: high G+C Gram-positive bacteria) TaxID=84139 RepID=UPI002609E2CE|nr:alcohol dehydrogenase catalytic domain-containing protein [Gordonia sp. (in: high G+C Gram-positive bacteria)]
MRAVKLTSPSTVTLEETPVPEPGPGEIRVKVAGAGLCHSDLHLIGMGDAWPAFGITLGHEGAGYVDALGSGVTGHDIGAPVIVNLLWSCGDCRACVEGRDNACEVAGGRDDFPTTPGISLNGSMADYVIAPARHVLPLGDIDPVGAGPLTDAGLTPMHAINSVRRRLTPGATVVILGIGGLGHVGLQIVKAISAARVIAIDNDEKKLAHAAELGADLTFAPGPDTAAQILELTGGYGADVVLDFVGVQPTVDTAAAVIAPEGLVRLVGLGGGAFPMRAVGLAPWGVDVQRSYGGTRSDLLEVLALAAAGQIRIDYTTYPLEDFQRAIDDLHDGRVIGRAVLVP